MLVRTGIRVIDLTHLLNPFFGLKILLDCCLSIACIYETRQPNESETGQETTCKEPKSLDSLEVVALSPKSFD
jgi:hypothetical protein